MSKKKKNKKSQSKGSVLNVLLYFVLPIVALVFVSLFLKTEIKFLYKEIDRKENEVDNLLQQLETRMVEVQKLSAEDRIVEYAKSKLSMVRINNNVDNIFVSKLKVEQIQKIVDSKYE